jgi:hypothetical protein
MIIPVDTLQHAATRLHHYLLKEHWNGHVLVGSDSGIRFNARIGRFIKSYLDFLPWSDRYIYLQAQGYWILNNWLMADLLDDEQCKELAQACSEYVLAEQQPEGYWEYPNPEWKDRIATVEGCFATLGLLESYCRTQQESLLTGAKKWYQYAIDKVGFQGDGSWLAINYFANVPTGMVPNNTTLALMTFARLADATQDSQYIWPCRAMVTWLSQVQLETGELPYSVGSSQGKGHTHYLCYQYNAFEFLDLAQYYRMTGDQAVWSVLEELAIFLSKGISESGAARYDCHCERPEVPYYTAALAAALSQATALGLGYFRPLADRAYKRILSQQRTDGQFEFFSRGNYGLLTDRGSYPRNLSMILYHLLLEAQTDASSLCNKSLPDGRNTGLQPVH